MMARFLLLLSLSSLIFLSACGSSSEKDNNDLLEMMNGDDTYTEDEVPPTDLPYSEGPKEIPSDLIPNGQ